MKDNRMKREDPSFVFDEPEDLAPWTNTNLLDEEARDFSPKEIAERLLFLKEHGSELQPVPFTTTRESTPMLQCFKRSVS